MNTTTRRTPARPATPSASTYDGFYFRGNPASRGQVPAAAPYTLCPDIIRSGAPMPDAQKALSTATSLSTFYDCAPVPGGSNYYYLRGRNGAPSGTAASQLRLFWAPAQLILFPSTWKNNPLATATGAETVPVSARSGDVGVGEQPFVWKAPPLDAGSTFYSLVAQAKAAAGPATPLPGDWIGMSGLLTQELGFGFRNMTYVDAGAAAWMHQVGITIPGTVGTPGDLILSVTASGFGGCTLGLVADRFTAGEKMVALQPVQLGNSFMTGIEFTADPGFGANLTIQCWNPGVAVAPGSTITLTVSYVVPDHLMEEAMTRGGLDSGYGQRIASQVPVGPRALLPLGTMSFVAGLAPEPGS